MKTILTLAILMLAIASPVCAEQFKLSTNLFAASPSKEPYQKIFRFDAKPLFQTPASENPEPQTKARVRVDRRYAGTKC